MNSTGYYRDRAEYYRRAAGESENATLRDQFAVLAGDYDELAKQSERGLLASKKLTRRRPGASG